jgi:hypothetical protein
MEFLPQPGKRRGQASVEFMFIFILFVAALSLAAVFVMQSSQGIYQSGMGIGAEELLSQVKGALDSAYLEGDGFSTNLTLPSRLLGSEYFIGTEPGYVFIEVSNQTYSKTLLARNLSGSLRKGENMLRNVNQEVLIS